MWKSVAIGIFGADVPSAAGSAPALCLVASDMKKEFPKGSIQLQYTVRISSSLNAFPRQRHDMSRQTAAGESY